MAILELTPITLLYIVVILFRIRATAAPIVGLVFFSQNILDVYRIPPLYTALVYSTNSFVRILLHIAFFMRGIWNLDLFHFSIPPFCVSGSINNVYAVALEYVSALYPLFLVVITFFLIELHAHNVRVIVWLYKPFHKCFVKFRRTWDIKQSIINAFSTFLLLSYTKIIMISFKMLYITNIYDIYGDVVAIKLIIDPQIAYLGAKHTPLAVFALLITATLILAIILLVVYPTKLFQRLIGRCHCRAIHGVHAFVDTYQGCLKDYTSGTRDYQAVSAAYLAMRFILLLLYVQHTKTLTNGPILIIFGILFMLLLVLMGTFKPYKENYMNYCELLLLFLNGVVLMLAYVWFYIQSSGVYVVIVLAFIILIPHIPLIAYIIIHLFRHNVISACQWAKKQQMKRRQMMYWCSSASLQGSASLPYRLLHSASNS